MIGPPSVMVDSDHPRQNMWRKKLASVLHRNACCPCATYLRTPHNSLAPAQALPPITTVRDFTEPEIGFFLNVDFVDHVALVAVVDERYVIHEIDVQEKPDFRL